MINILVADDAPQFKLLTTFLVLCWIHMGRHIKKLNPIVPLCINELQEFQKKFWSYYNKLKEFQQNPNNIKIDGLEKEFDKLFATTTNLLALGFIKRILKVVISCSMPSFILITFPSR